MFLNIATLIIKYSNINPSMKHYGCLLLLRDHAGGNEQLVSMVQGLTVCGNDDRIGAMNKRVKHGDQFKVTQDHCVFQYCIWHV